jgi:hypothetical protein
MNDDFNKYIQNTEPYFSGDSYNEEAVQLMFNALNLSRSMTYQTYFAHKKRLLDFEAELSAAHYPLNIAS